jgi:hypothetical protein
VAAMNERSAVYEFLVRKTGVDPAVVLEVDISSPNGDGVGVVQAGERLSVPGFGDVHLVVDETGWPLVTLPKGLEHTGTRSVPVVDPKLPDAPASAAEYWERAAMLAEEVAAFKGRFQLAGGRENGWIPIVEQVVVTIVEVLGPRDVVTVMFQLTFGMLGVSIRANCENHHITKFVIDLGRWAEAVALQRCMVSGEPGRRASVRDDDPWEYTLSDRVRQLPDPLAPDLLYPSPSRIRS